MSEQNIRQLLDSAIKYANIKSSITTSQYECIVRYFKTNTNEWINFVKLFDSGKQATVIKLLLSQGSVCGGSAPVPSSPFSFACSPGIGCHKVSEAPNKARGLYADIQSCNASCGKSSELPDDLIGVGGRGLMGMGFGRPGFEERTAVDQNLINRYKGPGQGNCKNFPSSYPAPTDMPIWENYLNEPSCKIMDYRTEQDKKMLLKYNNVAVNSYNLIYPVRPSWENF
jgi:hypothetical protein